MYYILLALGLFALSVALHIQFCRKAPKNVLHAKVFIYYVLGGLGIYGLIVSFLVFDPQTLGGAPLKITAALMYMLLVPVYLSFYVLTQLMSPSKKILFCICRQGSASYADILKSVEEETFIDTRLNDLLTSGCVSLVEGRYRLNPSGYKIAKVLDVMQMLLGRDIGG